MENRKLKETRDSGHFIVSLFSETFKIRQILKRHRSIKRWHIGLKIRWFWLSYATNLILSHLNSILPLQPSQRAHTHTHTLTWISLTLTDTTSPLGLCVQRSPIRRCPPWFFSASFALVTHLSARYLAFPLSRRQVLEMSGGVICHKCPKHAWSERYHPRWNACSPRVLTDVLGTRFPSLYKMNPAH